MRRNGTSCQTSLDRDNASLKQKATAFFLNCAYDKNKYDRSLWKFKNSQVDIESAAQS
jgi:hypothetical protein